MSRRKKIEKPNIDDIYYDIWQAYSNSTQLVTATFKSACLIRKPSSKLLFHSDRDTQYTSFAFRKLLADKNITQSFSNSSNPYNNSMVESFFASMKREELYRSKYTSDAEFRDSVAKYIEFYNTKRPHGSIGYKIPDEMEKKHIELNRA